ncbi:hypothetical protein TNCV_2087671 [Trichonephila clavipes]|nr:hypothetical protein TNCV_2087671 [Trichonephila clavipes]
MNSDCTERKKVFRPSWSSKKRHPGYRKLFRPSWSLKKCHPGYRKIFRPSWSLKRSHFGNREVFKRRPINKKFLQEERRFVTILVLKETPPWQQRIPEIGKKKI